MGRELRMVPPKWEDKHPKEEYHSDGRLQPMYDESFEDAVKEWKEGYAKWEAKTHESYEEGMEYFEWDSTPIRRYYRPWKSEEGIWYQVWETVSEGTPVSPSFEHKEELIEYLANCGDDWSDKGWGLEAAKRFVESGSCCSFVVTNLLGNAKVEHGYEHNPKERHDSGTSS